MVLRLVLQQHRFTGLNVTLSAKVERVILAEKISAQELEYMLYYAAITRLRGFNRRYFHWLFLVKNDVLLDMQHVELTQVGRGHTKMLEDHDACDGQGCVGCGWVGQIARWIKDKAAPKHLSR